MTSLEQILVLSVCTILFQPGSLSSHGTQPSAVKLPTVPLSSIIFSIHLILSILFHPGPSLLHQAQPSSIKLHTVPLSSILFSIHLVLSILFHPVPLSSHFTAYCQSKVMAFLGVRSRIGLTCISPERETTNIPYGLP
jgi:hypothetical protein